MPLGHHRCSHAPVMRIATALSAAGIMTKIIAEAVPDMEVRN